MTYSKDERRLYRKKYYNSIENHEKEKLKAREYYHIPKNKLRQKEMGRIYRSRPEIKLRYEKYRLDKKIRVYNHYSNYDIKCNCCGERHIEFLSIDHVNNDGYEHRKTVKSQQIVNWLIKNNFPSGYQILCMNCNFAKGKDSDHLCVHMREINNF